MLGFLKKFSIGKKIATLFSRKIDEATLDALETLLYEADLGATLSQKLVEKSKNLLKKKIDIESGELTELLENELLENLSLPAIPSHFSLREKPTVLFIIGINGSGKTTSVAKLASFYKKEGKSVLIAAADTFRAAAIDQLDIWAKRAGIEIIKGMPMGDPAAVIFDAIKAGVNRGIDLILVDTAGRQHSRTDLMGELEKMKRVAAKCLPGAPHETLLVLDATVGQNALSQALSFHQTLPLTGLILTKLDGTAKGGAALALQQQLKLPIRFIGTGEGLDDLAPFEAKSFIHALLN